MPSEYAVGPDESLDDIGAQVDSYIRELLLHTEDEVLQRFLLEVLESQAYHMVPARRRGPALDEGARVESSSTEPGEAPEQERGGATHQL